MNRNTDFVPRHNPPKAVTYARVSSGSPADEEGESLPWQTRTAKKYIEDKGWVLVDTFEEVVGLD